MTQTINRQVLLAKRPEGAPKHSDFRIVDGSMAAAGAGELLLRNLYLSLDPYMRGRMNDSVGSYAPPYALHAPPGGGTVARVVASHRGDFTEGDLVVVPDGGWQSFVVSDGTGLRRLPKNMAQPSQALGVLGMTGFTAWWCRPLPGRSGPWSARSDACSGAASWGSRAAPTNAVTSWRNSGSTPALTIARRILLAG